MNRLRIGVVGAGVLGSFHIGKCRANPGIDFAGFYDHDPGRLAFVGEKSGGRAYADCQSLLADSDAIIIATPASTHLEIARLCLDAGKHLLIEKPLAASWDEGAELVRRSEEAGLTLHVGHSEAFNPAYAALLAFGPRPRFIEVHRLAAFSPRGTDVPVVLDLMVHDLQLILRLCKEEPVYGDIAATGVAVISDDIDIANVRLVFPSGCVANCTASRISAKRMRKVRVFEKDNYYSADLDTGELDHYSLTHDRPSPAPSVSYEKQTGPPADALEAEQRAFVRAINGASDHGGVTGKEALTVLKVTDAVLKLLQAGAKS